MDDDEEGEEEKKDDCFGYWLKIDKLDKIVNNPQRKIDELSEFKIYYYYGFDILSI